MKKIKGERFNSKIQYRSANVENVNEENRTIEFSFSSEEPVDNWFGTEILDHQNNSVRLDWLNSGNAPFLADHDPSIVIGVVEKAWIGSDNRGMCQVRFGKGEQAESYFQDYLDGIRKNISVGYRIYKIEEQEVEEGELEVYRVVDWEPYEVSLVSIPADKTVGIGRSDSNETNEVKIIKLNANRGEIMEKENQNTPATPEVDINAVRTDELTRIREIQAYTEKFRGKVKDIDNVSKSFLDNGKSVAEFRNYITDNMEDQVIRSVNTDAEIGLNQQEAGEFSFLRMLNAIETNDWSKAGFERSVLDATKKKYAGKRSFQGTYQIPVDALMAGRNSLVVNGKRDLNITNATEGAEFVSTDHRADSFIELLRNKLVLKKAGAYVMSGLVGNVTIPKQTSAATWYWLGEGGTVTESTQGTNKVSLSPKTGAAKTHITRQMLLQSSPDAEMFVKNDLVNVAAVGIDLAGLKGTGASNQPRGIINQAGINSVTITAGQPTYDDMVDMETAVATQNADIGALSYVTSISDRGYMKKTLKDAGVSGYIWENNEINGYNAMATNQLSANENIFGNFNDLIIGEWGVLDLQIDPYTNGDEGGLVVRVFQDVDIAVRNPKSFCVTVTA